MRILIEISHPAQVHFFRNAVKLWKSRGQQVLIASRQKECLTELLDQLGLEHVCISTRSKGLLGLGWELLRRDAKMLGLVRKFRPDVLVGRIAISACHAGFLTRRPVIVFEDTEHASLQQKLSLPFASIICSTECYQRQWGPRQVRYGSIDHLAYTHPRYFQPDPAALKSAGLEVGEPYSVLRLVSWEAAHDRGVEGLTQGDVQALIDLLQTRGKVLISAEGSLPERWQHMKYKGPASAMLSVLACAKIHVGEGGSMASESACLGVPAVYVNRLQVGYLKLLEERFGLVRRVRTGPEALEAAGQMLKEPAQRWESQRRKLLEDMIDVTDYVVRLVEHVGGGVDPQAAHRHALEEITAFRKKNDHEQAEGSCVSIRAIPSRLECSPENGPITVDGALEPGRVDGLATDHAPGDARPRE